MSDTNTRPASSAVVDALREAAVEAEQELRASAPFMDASAQADMIRAANALSAALANTPKQSAGLDDAPVGMKRLIEMAFAVDQDGDSFHVRNSTRVPDGISWADAFNGARQIADDVVRQVNERFNCPYHPKNIKENGIPAFANTPKQSAGLVDELRRYDCPEACIGKTQYIPISRATLRRILSALEGDRP